MQSVAGDRLMGLGEIDLGVPDQQVEQHRVLQRPAADPVLRHAHGVAGDLDEGAIDRHRRAQGVQDADNTLAADRIAFHGATVPHDIDDGEHAGQREIDPFQRLAWLIEDVAGVERDDLCVRLQRREIVIAEQAQDGIAAVGPADRSVRGLLHPTDPD